MSEPLVKGNVSTELADPTLTDPKLVAGVDNLKISPPLTVVET